VNDGELMVLKKFRELAARIKEIRRGCGGLACNIGGGLCADCDSKLYTILRELEALA
jgi:hypothetical protein